MYMFSRIRIGRVLVAGLCGLLSGVPLLAQTSVRAVKVLGAKDAVEIEVEASDRVVPQTQILTGPDRLVIDFPNAVPGSQLRSQSIDRGQVKDLRVGLFQSKPPVTRMVLDLNSEQSYEIFPNGRTVMIKVMGGGGSAAGAITATDSVGPKKRAGILAADYKVPEELITEESSKPTLEVSFRDGLLGIKANKVTLSQVLYAVQQRTGADIAIASGAEQETVVTDIAPALPAEVLARLLNGSRFNFLILSASNDPRKLDRVILSTRAEGEIIPMAPPMPPPAPDEAASANDTPPGPTPPPSTPPPAVPATAPGNAASSPNPMQPSMPADVKAPDSPQPNQ